MQVADGAHAFEKRRNMQDRRFHLPAADDLDVNRQAFLARSRSTISLYDAPIDSYREAGLLPA